MKHEVTEQELVDERRRPENAAIRKRVDALIEEAVARSNRVYRKVLAVIGSFVLVLFGLMAYVFDQSYQGRRGIVMSNQNGCHRTKANVVDVVQLAAGTAAIGQAVQSGFFSTDARLGGHPTRDRRKAETELAEAIMAVVTRARSIEDRNGPKLVCNQAFPPASPWPWDN